MAADEAIVRIILQEQGGTSGAASSSSQIPGYARTPTSQPPPPPAGFTPAMMQMTPAGARNAAAQKLLDDRQAKSIDDALKMAIAVSKYVEEYSLYLPNVKQRLVGSLKGPAYKAALAEVETNAAELGEMHKGRMGTADYSAPALEPEPPVVPVTDPHEERRKFNEERQSKRAEEVATRKAFADDLRKQADEIAANIAARKSAAEVAEVDIGTIARLIPETKPPESAGIEPPKYERIDNPEPAFDTRPSKQGAPTQLAPRGRGTQLSKRADTQLSQPAVVDVSPPEEPPEPEPEEIDIPAWESAGGEYNDLNRPVPGPYSDENIRKRAEREAAQAALGEYGPGAPKPAGIPDDAWAKSTASSAPAYVPPKTMTNAGQSSDGFREPSVMDNMRTFLKDRENAPYAELVPTFNAQRVPDLNAELVPHPMEGMGKAAGVAKSAMGGDMMGAMTGGMEMMGGEIAAAAGPVGAIVAASIAAIDLVKGTISYAIKGVGNIATAIANPSADTSVAIGSLGDAATELGDKTMYLSPIMGILASSVGDAAKALSGFMQAVDKTAERYGEYSPQIAQAQAIAEIRQTMGDFRRAQEVSMEMAKYLTAQSDLQQKFEDIKVKLLNQILPAVTRVIQILEAILPSGQGIENAISTISIPLSNIGSLIDEAINIMRKSSTPEVEDPTSIIIGQTSAGNYVRPTGQVGDITQN